MIGRIVAKRYRIDELIGSGGMANVYRAQDTLLNRTVALKVLKEEHRTDAEFVRRFAREAQAVLSLSHDNIVRSYDVGEDDDISFIVLEYVEGKTLKDVIKENGPIAPKQAVAIAAQVLDALEHAHDAGIIHRDVKPQNVIITPKGKAKLTDFGIAKDAAATTRTFAGTNVIGSVHYLSPEQARGGEVTAESDIYSTGIMMYEMLTGQVPFAGDNSVAIALKHLQENIVPPVEMNPKLPRSLSDVVVKAASKKPQQRYASAEDMKADLQRSLREPHGRFARVKSEPRTETKKKTRVGAGNIALLVVVVIGLFAAMFFIARSLLDSEETMSADFVVPTMLGKSVDDAEDLAQLRGFKLQVSGYESSTDYADGTVLSQTPVGGSKSESGATITVVLSTGNDLSVVPSLLGMSIQDAMLALEGESLLLGGDITYDDTSSAPEGTVIAQNPGEGTQLLEDDYVNITVSGRRSGSIEMPMLTGMELSKAVALASENGFEHVRVYIVGPEDTASNDKADEEVLRQAPTSGMATSKSAVVEIWVKRLHQGAFASDVAVNLDIEESEKNVIITAKVNETEEIVLYQSTLDVGLKQTISFTAYLRRGGEYDCIVYVDGEEVKRCATLFEAR